jgi:hypothetical protein
MKPAIMPILQAKTLLSVDIMANLHNANTQQIEFVLQVIGMGNICFYPIVYQKLVIRPLYREETQL